MTLIGQKKGPNQPRKPMKRSPLRRKAPMKRSNLSRVGQTAGNGGNGSPVEYEAFMSQFRGLPSIISGRTRSPILKDENGMSLLTEGHHILPCSVYPEYKMEKWNIAVLTREEHSWAEDNPKAFDNWLHDNCPVAWKCIEEHRHHRK